MAPNENSNCAGTGTGGADTAASQIDIWHVAYPVADLDRSISFYCNCLGFLLVGRDTENAFVSLGKRGFTIEFLASKATPGCIAHPITSRSRRPIWMPIVKSSSPRGFRSRRSRCLTAE
jgi:hypothetical protein